MVVWLRLEPSAGPIDRRFDLVEWIRARSGVIELVAQSCGSLFRHPRERIDG